jgi:sec-independent protein translocase protein TatA
MLGYGELIVILFIILILFGGKKLPEFAKSLGKGIHEFKKAIQGDVTEEKITPPIEEKENDPKQ